MFMVQKRHNITSSLQKIKKDNVMKIKLAVLFSILMIFLFSCTNKENLLGSWQNEQRTLSFNSDSTFTINFNDFDKIKTIRGTYFLQNQIIYLSFKELQNSENNWISIENTDLNGYIESMSFSIFRNTLVTKIMATDTIYEYIKVEE